MKKILSGLIVLVLLVIGYLAWNMSTRTAEPDIPQISGSSIQSLSLKNVKKNILGTWRLSDNASSTVEYKSDGTGVIRVQSEEATLTWTLEEKDSSVLLKQTSPGISDVFYYTVLQADDMTLKLSSGVVGHILVFSKVR